ncbi:hypothetical protein AWC38_SpisGene2590 [Stylophora pistillata]|uniref:Uncharacterized protein n=1 Tax=Stylophora pistillata TaxID=50429 RepID=A0A2B4SRP9_STYPI|nr:hypothetical protein AWC38_SpisGene2590 [Stylophora pistillata]
MAILDIIKTLMYDFHYNYMKKKYGDNADSLMYEIETEDFYKYIAAGVEEKFDTSNFPKDHISKIPTGCNKKVVGTMKDEAGGKVIEEFVGLREKLYSYKILEGKEEKRKGIKKTVIKKNITHEDYKKCLFSGKIQMRKLNVIRSHRHEIFTSKDVKQRTNELVNLAFSARHKGISIWVLTQQMTSIAKPFRENIAALVLFYTHSAKDMKATFDDYTCDAIVDIFLQLSCKVLAYFLPVDEGKLMKDLNNDFIVKRELGMIGGSLSLKYGKYMAITSAALLTAKNVEVPLIPNVVNVEVESNCEEPEQVLSVASIVLDYYKRKELMELVKSRPNPELEPETRQIQCVSAGESAELPQIPKGVKPMD